jgi:DNA repair exonuclease SbcCD ATPase subunit
LRTIERLDREVAAEPPGLRSAPYDPTAHTRARTDAERHRQADAACGRWEKLAATEPAERDALASAQRNLDAATQRYADLVDEIRETTPDPARAAALADELDVASRAAKEAGSAAREAAGARGRAEEAVRAADADVEAARQRARRVEEARRGHLVAARTEDVLRALLRQITEDALPTLTDLIDAWGRALLGARFRSVRLTADYAIAADGGSGVHALSHFSGGEQTLLALMLRVAIARYCHERAGWQAGFLILDEIFGDQDVHRRAQLVEFLGEIQPHFSQIIVVNHVEDVTNMLDTIIEVVRTGTDTSTARIRT